MTPPDERSLQELEDAASARLQARFQRVVGVLALAGGLAAMVALWALAVDSTRAHVVAVGVALVGFLVTLFGEQVTSTLRRRRRRRR